MNRHHSSSELNKILGTILGIFLCVLAVHLAAGAIFIFEIPATPSAILVFNSIFRWIAAGDSKVPQ